MQPPDEGCNPESDNSDEDRLSDILGDLIAKAAVPVFDEAFKARAETIVNLTMQSAGLLANLIAERLKRHGTE